MKKLRQSQYGLAFPLKFSLKMRLTLLCLLLPLLGLQAKTSFGQKTITLTPMETTVSELLETIENKTDYRFVYKIEDVELNRKINVSAFEEEIPKVLDKVFSDTKVTYELIDDHIFLVAKEKDFSLSDAFHAKDLFQDKIQVSGIVTDASGVPIPGVNITVKGTTKGTATDFDGNFEIEIEAGQTLVFSSIGFEDQTMVIDSAGEITVTMQEGSTLDEVVVVGYGTLEKREVTSAISSVKESSFNQGAIRSPMDLIQGKVAGLNITLPEGNNPNSGPSIQLRGVTSLSGTRTPLIVIDGIPGGNLDLLQQGDIQSIDVLKDGSAAAIYGTRGNAGVILITTKKGSSGAAQYGYNTYISRDFVNKKPNFLNATEFRGLMDDGLISKDQDFGSSTDLYDELINDNNFSQYHNFTASGGGNNSNYRASLFYKDTEGIAKENGREEFGGRINLSQTGFEEKLNFQLNIASNFNNANLLGGSGEDFEQAIQRNPTAPIRNEDGTFYETQAFNNYNPLSRLANRISKRTQQSFSGDAKLEYKIIDNLVIGGFGSYVRETYNDRSYRSSLDWDQRENSSYQGMGYASKFNSLSWSKTFEGTLKYDAKIGDKHSIGAIAGYSYQYNTLETFEVNNNGFTTDGFLDWNLGAGNAINNDKLPRPGMGSFKEDNRLIGFFGRVNYNYLGKYYAQIIFRREGSSKFGKNHKWGNFPAISAGWNISDEPFMFGVQEINDLKIRVGYGVTGNEGIPNYQSIVSLSTGGVYPQNGVYYQTYGASRNPNPNLKWEEKKELNVGLDFGILNNRISGSFDIYNRVTTDLLYNYRAQQPSFVRDEIFTNVGELKNRGVEVAIFAIPVQTNDFDWSISFTGSKNSNELSQLSNEAFQATWLEFGGLPSPGNLGNAIRLEEKGQIGNFYGKRFAGFDDQGKWLFYKQDGSVARASEMNEEDLTIIGNGVPDYQASLGFDFNYKNFDLSVFFRGKFGFDILNTKELYFGNKKWLPNNLLGSALTDHKELNDDPQYSDYYLEKGDFVKLDNITLGYNFDLDSRYIRNLRFYISGRNIMTLTGYSGINPELEDTGFTTGIDSRGFYPRTSTWTIGINVGF